MGYAKDVLVSSDWVAEHLRRRRGRCRGGGREHGPVRRGSHPGRGQAALEGRSAGSDRARHRREGRFEQLLGERGIGNDTTVVVYGDKNNWFAAYAYWYLKVYGHEDVRILDGGRQKWIDEGRELTTNGPTPAAASYSRQGPRRDRFAPAATRCSRWIGDRRPCARRRAQPAGVRRRADGAARLRAGGRVAHRPHPERAVDPVGAGRPDDGTFKSADDLRELYAGKGVTADKEVDRVLPHRRAQRAHLVRAARAARLRGRPQLRRLVDRVGQPRRRPDRALAGPEQPGPENEEEAGGDRLPGLFGRSGGSKSGGARRRNVAGNVLGARQALHRPLRPSSGS